MDIRQLRYFNAVARQGSFMGASRALHVSQPALGYQVKQLEAALGTELLFRHSRGASLTEAGRILLEHSERIMDAIREAESALEPFRDKLMGDIVFGVTPTAGRALAPSLLDRCARKTALRVTLHQGMSNHLYSEMMAGSVDLAFCYDPQPNKRLASVPLYRETLFLIGPPDVVENGKPVAVRRLVDFSLLLDSRIQSLRQLLDSAIEAQGTRLRDVVELEAVNLRREMILHHRRCTVSPYGLFREDLRQGHVAARQIVDPPLMRTMHLVTRHTLSAAVKTFMISAIQEIVQEELERGELGWQPVGKQDSGHQA